MLKIIFLGILLLFFNIASYAQSIGIKIGIPGTNWGGGMNISFGTGHIVRDDSTHIIKDDSGNIVKDDN